MLLLTATTDKLQLITSATATVDVHASWMDSSNADPPAVKGSTSGRQNTAITSAGTNDIVPALSATGMRNVKTLHIFNKDSANSTDVTVVFNQNATQFTLWKATLGPGEALEYIEGIGFFEAQSSVAPVPPTYATADQSLSAAATAYITGSSIAQGGKSLRVGSTFTWDLVAVKTGAGTTTGSTFDVRVGTAGTTGDASRVSISHGTPTAVADVAIYRARAVVRSIGASGSVHFMAWFIHHLQTTGWDPLQARAVEATVTMDTTATNWIWGLSMTTQTADVKTVKQVQCGVENLLGASVGP